MTKHILYAIGWLWLLPVNLLALCWLLPMKKKGTFQKIWWDWDSWSWNWDVSNDSEFYKNSMNGWWGFVIGNNIIYVDYFPELARDEMHITHERTHVLQNYMFGVFFYPLYIAHTLFIMFFQWRYHAYYDNFFEVWARRSAGQQIFIPVGQWKHGPNDRFPWW